MDNILPDFKAFSLTSAAGNTFTQWDAKDSLPRAKGGGGDDKAPYHLQIHPPTFVSESWLRTDEFKYGVPMPNQRHLDGSDFYKPGGKGGIAPLSILERGICEETKITIPPTEKPTGADGLMRRQAKEKKPDVILTVSSTLPSEMDFFLQTKATISSFAMRPFTTISKILHKSISNNSKYGSLVGTKANTFDKTAYTGKKSCHVLFSSTKRASILMTVRQEIRDFFFKPGPIGIQAQISNNKLTCIRTIEGSQAALHGTVLDGAELIAVNGKRVVNLKEFQMAILAAQETGNDIIVQAASYKGKKMKIDDLYASNLKSKSQSMTLLLTGMLGSAKNPSQRPDSSDEEESEDEEESTVVEGEGDDDGEEEEEEEEEEGGDGEENEEDLVFGGEGDDEEDEEGGGLRAKRVVRIQSPTDGDVNDSYPTPTTSKSASTPNLQPLPMIKSSLSKSHEGLEEGSLGSQSTYSKRSFTRENSIDNIFTGEGWDNLTAVDIFPFRRVVNVPKYLRYSNHWGTPDKTIQFANFSSTWDVEVFWIDEDGAFVSRIKLGPGQRHVEMTSRDHVWCVVAQISEFLAKKLNQDDEVDEDHHNKYMDLDLQETIDKSPAMMLLRPSNATLDDSISTSVMWSPWHSSTIAQRPRTKLAPVHKDRHLQSGLKTAEEAIKIESHIYVNVFDHGKPANTVSI